jgi:hypothetical protein
MRENKTERQTRPNLWWVACVLSQGTGISQRGLKIDGVFKDHSMIKWCVPGLLLLAALSSQLWAGDDRRMYRYHDQDGVLVIRDHIPPQFVRFGYDIMRTDGTLVESVPAAPTEEELAARYGDAQQRKLLEEQERAQQEADKRLLTIFSHPDDAERARDRRIEALDVIIGVHRGNIISLRSELDQTQHKAANIERSGRAVPEDIVQKLDSLNRQIANLEADIAVKEREKTEVRESYAKDIARLKKLLGRERQTGQ